MSQTKAQLVEGLNINTSAPADALVIDSSGRVGIGRTSASSMLDIQAASGRTQITLRNVGNTSDTSTFVAAEEMTSGNADLILAARHSVRFFSNLSEKMRTDSSGNLLVGLTSAVGIGGTPADLNSTEIGRGYINISRDDTQAADHILFGKNGSVASSIGTSTTNSLVFKTGTTEKMRIDSSGNVSIGTSTFNLPSGKGLQVYDSSTPRIKLANSTTGTGSTDGSLLYVSGSDLLIENKESANMRFYTAATERMRIDSSGRLFVGGTVATPSTTSADDIVIAGSGNIGLTINSTNSAESSIFFADGTSGSSQYMGQVNYYHSTDALTFASAGSERLRVDSSGRLLVGTTTSRIVEDHAGNGPQGKIQIEGTNSDGILSIISAGTADANRSGTLSLGRHRNGTIGGTPTLVQNGDSLGAICFAGGDGTDMRTKAAKIVCEVDGTPGSNDMPGRLMFSTTADGASSPTERLRITSGGFIGIGTSSPDMRLDVTGSVSAGGGSDEDLQQWNIGSDNVKAEIKYVDASATRGMRFGTSTNHLLAFQTNNTERMRLDTSGNLFFASFDDSSNSGFGAKINVTTNSGDVKAQCISTASQYTQLYGGYFGSAVTFYVLANGNVLNTNNSYGQISDQKLKENIVDANSQWNNIKDVRVRNFNFIEGQTHTQIGVVAQELEAVSPGLIDEAPDRDEEGNDLGTVTKSVKYSVLYMKAVKALQEAMTRIETLETKVAALEAG